MAINDRAAIRALALVTVLLLAPRAYAQVDETGVFASFTGSLSNAHQRDIVTLDVNTQAFDLNSAGRVNLTLLLKAAPGSTLDPGLVRVAHDRVCARPAIDPQKKDTADSEDAITLANMPVCLYEVMIESEKKSKGEYVLEVMLSGDVNGDLAVDDEDLSALSSAIGKRAGQRGYLRTADVDRNGAVNGGDRARLIANLGASAKHESEFLPRGALVLASADPRRFNDPAQPLRFTLEGAEFDIRTSDVTLTINGNQVPHAFITISPQTIQANAVLTDGKNEISLKAYDTGGRPLYLDETVWVGNQSIEVFLRNPDGSAFLQSTTITAKLSDDPTVIEQGNTSSGGLTFSYVPTRTIIVSAKTPGNVIGSAGLVGGGQVVITMAPIEPLSPTKNLSFDMGSTGWKIGSATVLVVPHLEDIPGFGGDAVPMGPMLSAAADNDLELTTTGEGARTISHTFNTSVGASAVRVRYRFVTSEVPGGYFGSEFNDYFSVSIRSKNDGGLTQETDSMNGLGLGAFDFASGSTAWRDELLLVDPDGDTVQVDVSVANVADGLLDSKVIVDFVEEQFDVVAPSLSWNNAAGGIDLTYRVEATLAARAIIDVHWASSSVPSSRLGPPIATFEIPAGTSAGTYGPGNIVGSRLASNPASARYLIASSSTKHAAALPDVVLKFANNARASDVAANAADVITDGLRAAGQSVGQITSTARTPQDQARIMFSNLTKTANIAANIAAQLNIYAPAGDAVIRVFEQRAVALNMSRNTILNNEASISAAMTAAIVTQGPQNVSKHCASIAVLSVMDIARDPFNLVNRSLFVGSVAPRSSEFLIEPVNHCYHSAVPR